MSIRQFGPTCGQTGGGRWQEAPIFTVGIQFIAAARMCGMGALDQVIARNHGTLCGVMWEPTDLLICHSDPALMLTPPPTVTPSPTAIQAPLCHQWLHAGKGRRRAIQRGTLSTVAPGKVEHRRLRLGTSATKVRRASGVEVTRADECRGLHPRAARVGWIPKGLRTEAKARGPECRCCRYRTPVPAVRWVIMCAQATSWSVGATFDGRALHTPGSNCSISLDFW